MFDKVRSPLSCRLQAIAQSLWKMKWPEIRSHQTLNVAATSLRCSCNVTTMKRRCCDVVSLLGWAVTRAKVPSDICDERRLKSACASAQSGESIHCPNEETVYPWLSNNAPSEDSYQILRIRRLIWIFSGRTCRNVLTSGLESTQSSEIVYRLHILFINSRICCFVVIQIL